MLNIQKELMLMNDYNLTAEEMMFIELFFEYKINNNGEHIKTFISQCNTNSSKVILESLMNKRVLLKDDIDLGKKLSYYEFNKIFLKNYYEYSEEFGMELFRKYPNELISNSMVFKTKNISKRFDSLEELSYFYSKQIKFNKDKHEEIMEILDWAIENNRLFYGIVEFIVSHKWEELEEERLKGDVEQLSTVEWV